MEATSHGSVLRRLDRVRFAALVFTNLSQDHLDFHRDMEDYFDAKRRLFLEPTTRRRPPSTSATPTAAASPRSCAAQGTPLVTFGLADDADVRPDALDLAGRGDGARRRRASSAADAACAAASTSRTCSRRSPPARLLGIPDEAVAAGIESVAGVPGRFETRRRGPAVHGRRRLRAQARARSRTSSVPRASSPPGRVICVFGCGGDRDRGKRPLMGRIASELADVAIVTSDNPRSEDPLAIIDEVVAGMDGEPEVEPDRRARDRARDRAAGPGDVVVIAGKGHERGQETGRRRSLRSTTARWRARRCARCRRRHDRARARGGWPSSPPGRLETAPWAPARSRACRPTRAGSRTGDLFVAVGGGGRLRPGTRFARGAAAALVPDDAFAALAALAGARPRTERRPASSRSPARWGRPRRRTSSPPSARRSGGRSPPSGATTPRSASR